MPVQQFLPDARLQFFMDFIAQLRREEEQRDAISEASKDRKKARAIAGGGAAIGAGIGALAGAGGVAGIGGLTTATGTGGAAGAGQGALLGALSGGRAGQAFAGGDIAGGIANIASPFIAQQQGIDPGVAALLGPQGVGQLAGNLQLQRSRLAGQAATGARREQERIANALGVTRGFIGDLADSQGINYSEAAQVLAQQQAEQARENELADAQAEYAQKKQSEGFSFQPDQGYVQWKEEEAQKAQRRADLTRRQRDELSAKLLEEASNPPGKWVQNVPPEVQFRQKMFTYDDLPGIWSVDRNDAVRKVGESVSENDAKLAEKMAIEMSAAAAKFGRTVSSEDVKKGVDAAIKARLGIQQTVQEAQAEMQQEAAASAFQGIQGQQPVSLAQPPPAIATQARMQQVQPAPSPAPQITPEQQERAIKRQEILTEAIGTARQIMEQAGPDPRNWSADQRRQVAKSAAGFQEALQEEYGSADSIPVELAPMVFAILDVLKAER